MQNDITTKDFDDIDCDEWNTSLISSISADMEMTFLEVDELIKSISETKRPYIQLVEHLYGCEPVFPKLMDIHVPEDFHISKASSEIDKHIKLVNNQIIEILEKSETLNISDLEYVGFTMTKYDKEIVNIPKVKAYVELIELICESHNVLNDENTAEITNILMYKCYEMCRM